MSFLLKPFEKHCSAQDLNRSFNLAYYAIKDQCVSLRLEDFIPPPPGPRATILILDSVDHQAELNRMLPLLRANPEQSNAIDRIFNGVVKLAFVDGPGGTGKTFLYRCLYHMLKGQFFSPFLTQFSCWEASALLRIYWHCFESTSTGTDSRLSVQIQH